MKVKVWNDNKHPFKSIFKGDPIEIPAGKFVEMEFYEAHEFKGDYHPTAVLASGEQDPKTMKIIRIEKPDTTQAEAAKHQCMSCKHVSPSPEELEAHIKYRHADDAKLELPEEDAAIAAKKKTKKAG